MNRYIVATIWIILIAVSAITPLWNVPSTFLDQVMLGTLDPSQWFIFTSLGLFPLYFFIFSRNENQPLWRSMFYLFGLILGGFIIFPLEALNQRKAQPLSKIQLVSLAMMDTTLIILLGWSIIFGDWSVYIQSYQKDLFVYIMTWDFIAVVIVLFYKAFANADTYLKLIIKK
jgi:hypothetical protein